MNRIRLSLILCCLSAAFLSCNRELEDAGGQPSLRGGYTVLELSFEDTRTSLGPADASGERKVLWSDGDRINVNGADSRALSGVEGAASASFVFDAVLSYPYNILYPASAYEEGNLRLSAVQAYVPGSFASGSAPAAAYVTSSSESHKLKNLETVLCLSLKKGSAEASLKSLEFRGGDGEQVSGLFALDFQTASLSGISEAQQDRAVTLDVGEVALSSEAKDFYLVIPARNYEKGFVVTAETTDGQKTKIVRHSGIVFQQGKVVRMKALALEPGSALSLTEDYTESEYYFSGGKGTADEPYLISSAQDLVEMATLINGGQAGFGTAHYLQTAHIDLEAYDNFTPIGISTSANFKGTYDGGGHIISCLTLSNAEERPSALFANCGTGTDIRNLTLYDVRINTSYAFAAGLVGHLYRGRVDNCHVSGSVTSTGASDNKSQTGGVVGRVNASTVSNCSFKGTVTATSNHTGGVVASVDGVSVVSGCTFKAGSSVQCNYYCGGIAASLNEASARIENCVCEGSVSSNNWNCGGIVAIVYRGTVSSCMQSSVSTVTSANYNVGGIVGSVFTSNTAKNYAAVIDNCAAYGTVRGLYQVGGICGLCNVTNAGESGVISNCACVNATVVATGCNNFKYSLVAGICGYTQGSGTISVLNSFSRPATVNTTAPSSILGTAAILGYSNSVTHTLDNCYSGASPAQVLFGGQPVTSSSLVYYGSIVGRASAATVLNRCYYSNTLQMTAASGSSPATSGCQAYTAAQMTDGTLLAQLNAGLSSVSGASEWVAGADGYPSLSGLPADTHPAVARKRVSIIGDSISTYKGWIHTDNVNGHYCSAHYPTKDITSVEQTWWYGLIYNYMKNAQFEMNISGGNTTVVENTTATNYSSQYWYSWDFCTRFIYFKGVGNPDIVFIHGGTNDLGHISSYGASEELIAGQAMNSSAAPDATALNALFATADACTTVSQAEALAFNTFCAAYIKLVKMVRLRYPSAKVVCIIGDCVSEGMQSAIKSVADHYGARYVDFLAINGFRGTSPLTKYEGNVVHPDANGMDFMASTIYRQLGSWLEE